MIVPSTGPVAGPGDAYGLSLHIGINDVDRRYFPNAGYLRLRGCINDARAFWRIAQGNGFQPLALLLDGAATFEAVEHYLRQAATCLQGGGTFLLTYSGHGARISNGRTNATAYDTGLVLRNRIMMDAHLYSLLALFSQHTRIAFVCDSCHACSLQRFAAPRQHHPLPERTRRGQPLKTMEPRIVRHHMRSRRADYRDLQARLIAPQPQELRAAVAVLSACGDDDIAYDGPVNSRFMQALLTLLSYGQADAGTEIANGYEQLAEALRHYLEPAQRPQLTRLGPDREDPFFSSTPFTIYRH